MWRNRFIRFAGFVVGFGAFILIAQDVATQEKGGIDKRDLAASQGAEQFIKAVWKQDIGAVMNSVDVPFFWDGVENIKDRETLKDKLAGMLKKDRSMIPFKTKAVFHFGELLKKPGNKRDVELLSKILDKTDRIVAIEFKPPGRDGIAIAVRFRGDQIKVVGFRD